MTEGVYAKLPGESSGRLLAEITCPNCWQRFPPEDLLFIARHASLVGDAVAGPNAYRRFLPMRFTVAGNAVDSRGMECQDLACPRCHLHIARPLIEMEPTFVSIVGAPASGKSYYLAALSWKMRSMLAQFELMFTDGDPTANEQLQRYEETLFLNTDQETPVKIRKTETQGAELYQTVTLDGQSQSFPRPFVFTINPTPNHPRHEDPEFPYRSLVLYDNAGEHFLPGADTADSPVTRHLSRSSAILFVFDPTQDARFREQIRSEDPQLKHGLRPEGQGPETLIRQEVILNEMASRVRKHHGLNHTQRHPVPLVMILAKADLWTDLLGESIDAEPVEGEIRPQLDSERIRRVSTASRALLRKSCPEIVSAAEGFSQRVTYLPVSSLGTSPELVEQGGTRFYGIRPRDIDPKWVATPMLWALAYGAPELIESEGGG